MDRLERNWITNGLIDFEYKKYILLSYLAHVQKEFEDRKLFPVFQEISDHFAELREFKKSKRELAKIFPKEVEGIDVLRNRLRYRNKVDDSYLMEEIDAIVDFGLDAMRDKLSFGEILLEYVKEQILIEPIGISPIDKTEGYLFFYNKELKGVEIYKYKKSPVKQLKNDSDEINISFITKMNVTLVYTVEQIKRELLRIYKELPNPATFLIEAKIDIPHQETLIPVAKKLLIRKIAA